MLSVRGTVQSAVLDCDARLPSGKSTIARFGLRRTRPLLIFCDKGETPSQLPNSEFVRIEHVAPGGRGKSKGRAKRTRAAVINATALLDVIEKRTQLQRMRPHRRWLQHPSGTSGGRIHLPGARVSSPAERGTSLPRSVFVAERR